MKRIALILIPFFNIQLTTSTQAFVNLTQPIERVKAPGLKVKLLSTSGETKIHFVAVDGGTPSTATGSQNLYLNIQN